MKRRASDPVIMSGFLAILDHSGLSFPSTLIKAVGPAPIFFIHGKNKKGIVEREEKQRYREPDNRVENRNE